MRAVLLLVAILFAPPSLAGLGGLLKALSHADDVGKAAAKAATHADDAARAGAHVKTAAVHADDAHVLEAAASHADDGEGLGQKVGEAALDVATGAAPEAPRAIELELAKHQERMAKLNALAAVYDETHDAALLDKITRIRAKELARHATRMEQLR